MLPPPEERARLVHERLLAAYGPPDRERLPPLDELVCTILSQNTNDINRDRAFDELRRRFPSWEAVREADSAAVIDAIRVAGLANQKGPRIQAALRQISAERGELSLDFLRRLTPAEVRSWLTALKGVGPKTAAIVMLFSLDMPAFPVDTHVHRVSGRIGLRPPKMSAEKAHEHLADLLPPETYEVAHLNLIEHGRQICKAPTPRCEACMLTDLCLYYQTVYDPAAGGGADG